MASTWTRLRAVVGTTGAAAGLTAALMLGPGAGIASADSLDDVAHEYSLGTGGGQVSSLTRTALQLRAKGAQVSESQNDAIKAALGKRPNQMPLINTLKSIVATQTQFLKASQKPQRPVSIGVGSMPGYSPVGPGAMVPGMPGSPGLPPGVNPGPGIGVTGGGGSIINQHIPIAGTG